MKATSIVTRRLSAAVGAVIIVSCAGCGGTGPHPRAAVATSGRTVARPPTSRTSPTTGQSTPPVSGGSDAAFCSAARETGLADLQSRQVGTPIVRKLLGRLDSLDLLAPAEIKADFHTFDRVEHTLLDPGSPEALHPQQLGGTDVESALHHVQGYLRATCGIG